MITEESLLIRQAPHSVWKDIWNWLRGRKKEEGKVTRKIRFHLWIQGATGDYYLCACNGTPYVRYRKIGDVETCWNCGDMIL